MPTRFSCRTACSLVSSPAASLRCNMASAYSLRGIFTSCRVSSVSRTGLRIGYKYARYISFLAVLAPAPAPAPSEAEDASVDPAEDILLLGAKCTSPGAVSSQGSTQSCSKPSLYVPCSLLMIFNDRMIERATFPAVDPLDALLAEYVVLLLFTNPITCSLSPTKSRYPKALDSFSACCDSIRWLPLPLSLNCGSICARSNLALSAAKSTCSLCGM